MNKTQIALLSSISLACCISTHAGISLFPYISLGANIAQTTFDNFNPPPNAGGKYTRGNSAPAIGLNVGAKLNPYFSLETSGNYIFKSTYEDSVLGKTDIKPWTFDVLGKASAQIYKSLNVYIKAGLGYYKLSGSNPAFGRILAGGKTSLDHVGPTFAVGLNYYLTSHIELALQWQNFAGNIKFNNDFRSTASLPDLNMYSANFGYHFNHVDQPTAAVFNNNLDKFYLGINAGVGQTNYQDYKSQTVIKSVNYNHGNSGFTFGSDIGYQLNTLLATEFGGYWYQNVTLNRDSKSGKIKTWSLYAALKLIAPLANHFGLFGKAGIGYYHASASGLAEFTNGNNTLNHFAPFVGGGAEYAFNNTLSINLQLTRILESESVKPSRIITKLNPPFNMTTVGLQYRFAV